MRCKLVAYYRVSTTGQGKSGLGLEGQQAAVEAHSRSTGCQIVASYTEVESGRKGDRPELAKAIAHARRAGATLVIAKLDRLARNVHFLSGLMAGGVDFVACDNPNANKLTIHILAAVAEDETERISERTKAALAAYKARGGRLGTDNLTTEGRAKGNKAAASVIATKAREAYADLLTSMKAMRDQGQSYGAIANALNDQGHTTRTGKPWRATQVMRVLDRGS